MSILALLFNYASNGGAGIFEPANDLLQFLPAPFPTLSFILKGLRIQKKVKAGGWAIAAWKVTVFGPSMLHINDTNMQTLQDRQ